MTEPIDTDGVAAALADAAATVAPAADAAFAVPLPDAAAAVLLVGAGPSRSAVELVASTAACAVPTVVADAPSPPAWCGPGTLVVAVGVTGAAPDTVAAATAAAAVGGTLVVVAPADSPLASLDGVHAVCPLDTAVAPAVAHLPAAVATAVLLARGAGGNPVAVEDVASALGRRGVGFDAEDADGAHAERRAGRRIARTFPLVYGSTGAADAAARHWTRAVNRSAKAPSFAASHPACDHDVISGWGQAGDVTRQIFSLVELRHPLEPPMAAALFDASRELLEEVVASVREVRSDATDPFVAACDLAFAGDLVATSMAFGSEVDPGPVESVDRVFSLAGLD
jgi:hypothetical protein